ncbi:hypothetical protein [Curtobacterium sp. MCSS17_016]|uniref:hypothetical protein n=1 Tax=Curtobacterium sp. MCSS17_016 TaxID=2175644 RepID=UPI000DA975DC|nr:hypothetical protein [Curtobacterium sp. MCSS17_016]WIE81333.1 hypothetical protein DEJ19_019050 [Curtobacterium sp. MCSS17_016]
MAETMSNLERYLHRSNGIHFMLRRKMVAAYPTDTAITTMRALHADAPETHLSTRARADLAILIENEDADIRPVHA